MSAAELQQIAPAAGASDVNRTSNSQQFGGILANTPLTEAEQMARD